MNAFVFEKPQGAFSERTYIYRAASTVPSPLWPRSGLKK